MTMKRLKRLKQPIKSLLRIKKYEETTQFLIQRKPFERRIRDLPRERNTELNFKRTAIEALLEAAEAFLVKTFEITGILANHANRITILPKDIHLS